MARKGRAYDEALQSGTITADGWQGFVVEKERLKRKTSKEQLLVPATSSVSGG